MKKPAPSIFLMLSPSKHEEAPSLKPLTPAALPNDAEPHHQSRLPRAGEDPDPYTQAGINDLDPRLRGERGVERGCNPLTPA